METATKIIIEQGFADRFIRASRLNQLIVGSAKRRYGLVNRGMKRGELVREAKSQTKPCPFTVRPVSMGTMGMTGNQG